MKQISFVKQKWQTNFTLVELLVVIAIISILASLILPSLQTALESAKGSSCINNMKQLGNSSLMYQNDFDEYFFPGSRAGTVNPLLYTQNYHWDFYFGRNYYGYQINTWGYPAGGWPILQCPEDDYNLTNRPQPRSYNASRPTVLNTVIEGIPGKRISTVKNLSTYYLLAENTYDPIVTSNTFTIASAGRSGSNSEVIFWNSVNIGRLHSGAGNFIYADGHAATRFTWRASMTSPADKEPFSELDTN